MKKRYYLILMKLLISITLFSQTTIFSENFENGKGSWVFSTIAGGNDYGIVAATGTNASAGVRSKFIGTPNYMISPAVTFSANKPYKIRFWAKSASVNSRKMKVYYNTINQANGSEVLVDSTAYFTTSFAQYEVNLNNPPAGNFYIILKGKGTGYVYQYIDDFEVIEWGNYKPTVSITAPANNAILVAGNNQTVTANAADADGTVSYVEFYKGDAKVGTDTIAPYTYLWENMEEGTFALKAKAVDDKNEFTFSDIVNVVVSNIAPIATLTAPTNGTSINQNGNVLLTSTASDADGSVVKVEFYANNLKIGESLTAPYSFTHLNLQPGVYVFKAKAIDNMGKYSYSTESSVTVLATQQGTVYFDDFEFGQQDTKLSTTNGGNDWKFYKAEGYNGSTGLRSRNTNTGNNFVTTSKFYLSEGSTYTISFKSKLSGTSTIKMAAFIGTTTDKASATALDTMSLTTTFASRSCVYTPVSSGYYYLTLSSTSTGWINIFLDDIRIEGLGGQSDVAPVVFLKTPVTGTTFTEGQSITLDAGAYDVDGSIQKVEYWNGAVKLGETTTSPYTFTWSGVTAGSRTVVAKAIDANNNSKTSPSVALLINYPTHGLYDFTESSYIGGQEGKGAVMGSAILSNGTIALAVNLDSVNPGNKIPILLNGSTARSGGAVVILAPDGKSVKSVTRISNQVADMAIDNNDNIYVAAGTKGLLKLNSDASSMLYSKVFAKNVHRVDVGATGYAVVLTRNGIDFLDESKDSVSIRTLNPSGDEMGSFNGASQYTQDVCIDEATQTVVSAGWKQSFTWEGTTTYPVQISNYRGTSYSGSVKYTGYNHSSDSQSDYWVNRPENNMADTRAVRCTIGKDGKLYIGYDCAGGNHIFRYDPFDNMKKVKIVGGDAYSEFYSSGTEIKTFVGKYEPATGVYLQGQQFTARTTVGACNTAEMANGDITVDGEGRVYITGQSFSQLPITKDLFPTDTYKAGAFVLVLNPDFTYRELVTVPALRSGSASYTIAYRKFANNDHSLVIGGLSSDSLLLVQPIQGTRVGATNGFFSLIGGTVDAQKTLVVNNGVGSGSYQTGNVVSIIANTAPAGQRFAQWTGDVATVANVNSATTTFTVGNANATISATYINQYTLGVTNGTGSGAYLANEVINLVANAAPAGQRFDKWTGDVATVANVNNTTTTFIIGTANANVTASYVNEYVLTVNSGSGGGIYLTSEVINLVANAAPAGQRFDKWTGDVANIANVNNTTTTFTIGTANANVTASYVNEYVLTVNSGSGSGIYTVGSTVNIAANTAPSGQIFDTWTGDVSAIANVQDPTTTITLNAGATVTATYRSILVYYEDFNPIEGTWLYSTVAGGNDWKLTAAVGLNGTDGLRSKYNVNTNFAISTGVYLKANEHYKISYYSKAATANNRKITASYNTTQSITGQTAVFTTAFIGTAFTEYSSSFTVPADNTYYLSFSGSGATYNFLYIDDVKVSIDITFAQRSPAVKLPIGATNEIISVYPNPATKGYFLVNTNSIETTRIQVFNLFGSLIIDTFGAGNVTISTNEFKTGIYFVWVKDKVFKLHIK